MSHRIVSVRLPEAVYLAAMETAAQRDLTVSELLAEQLTHAHEQTVYAESAIEKLRAAGFPVPTLDEGGDDDVL